MKPDDLLEAYSAAVRAKDVKAFLSLDGTVNLRRA